MSLLESKAKNEKTAKFVFSSVVAGVALSLKKIFKKSRCEGQYTLFLKN